MKIRNWGMHLTKVTPSYSVLGYGDIPQGLGWVWELVFFGESLSGLSLWLEMAKRLHLSANCLCAFWKTLCRSNPLRTEKSFSMSEGANRKTTTYRGNLGKVHTPEKIFKSADDLSIERARELCRNLVIERLKKIGIYSARGTFCGANQGDARPHPFGQRPLSLFSRP